MIVFNNDSIEIEKLETQQKDILYTKCQIFNLELKILLAYFSAGNSEEDKQRDSLIRKECEKLIQNCTDSEKLIVLGDFNGHIGFIGQQKIDRKGEMVIDWMNDFNLILINGNERCVGHHTWSRENQKSTIDFALMNNEAYKIFQKMKIDEEKEIRP